jgi:hypothetical protein
VPKRRGEYTLSHAAVDGETVELSHFAPRPDTGRNPSANLVEVQVLSSALPFLGASPHALPPNAVTSWPYDARRTLRLIAAPDRTGMSIRRKSVLNASQPADAERQQTETGGEHQPHQHGADKGPDEPVRVPASRATQDRRHDAQRAV